MDEGDDMIGGAGEEIDASGDRVASKVVTIVAEVLGLPKETFGLDTVAADVEEWDSFGHVRIVLAIEKAFGIALSMAAIEQATSVAGLVGVVEAALPAG